MTTQAPTPKTKVKATRSSHPAVSKQRLLRRAQPTPTPALARGPSLKVVGEPKDEAKPTPPDALRRLEALERQTRSNVAEIASLRDRVAELEAQLGAEAEADAVEAELDASGAGDEASPEASVDPSAEDLGGESA